MLFKIFPWTRGLQTVRDYHPWGMKCTKQILEKQKLEKTSHYLFPSSSSSPITFSKPYAQGSLSLAFLKLWAKEQPQSLGTQQAGPEEAVLAQMGGPVPPLASVQNRGTLRDTPWSIKSSLGRRMFSIPLSCTAKSARLLLAAVPWCLHSKLCPLYIYWNFIRHFKQREAFHLFWYFNKVGDLLLHGDRSFPMWMILKYRYLDLA